MPIYLSIYLWLLMSPYLPPRSLSLFPSLSVNVCVCVCVCVCVYLLALQNEKTIYDQESWKCV